MTTRIGLGTTRREPRLTLEQQLSRNPRWKGYKLAIYARTPMGQVMRASEVVGKRPDELARLMAEVDAKRTGESAPTLLEEVSLPAERLIVVGKGTYGNIIVERDYRLFPLTMGFLKQFRGDGYVIDNALSREENCRRPDDMMVGYLRPNGISELLLRINAKLSGNVCLRLPEAPPIHAFMAVPEFEASRGINGLVLVLTSTRDSQDNFVYYWSYTDPKTQSYIVKRGSLPPDSPIALNCSVLLEVVSL